MKATIFLFALSILTSSLAHSAGAYFTINGVGVSNYSKTIYVTVNETIEESPCESTKTFRMKAGDDSLYKDVLSILLTAKVTEKKVKINYSTDANKCIANAPLFYSAFIK